MPPDRGGRSASTASSPRTSARAAPRSARSTRARSSTGSARPKSYRLDGGESVELPAAEAPIAGDAPPAPPRDRLGGRAPARRRQAGRARRPPGGRARVGHARRRARAAGSPAASRTGPGSSTGSTATPRACSCVARSEEAHRRLSALVRRAGARAHLPRARPRAGRARDTGRIEAPIGRDRDDPTRVSLDTDTPRDAVTHFEVERLWPDTRCCASGSRPGGCTRSASTWRRSTCRSSATRSTASASPALGRQFLHASELAFPHPFSGARVEARSALPADLAAYLADLELATIPGVRSSLDPADAPRRTVAGAVRLLSAEAAG